MSNYYCEVYYYYYYYLHDNKTLLFTSAIEHYGLDRIMVTTDYDLHGNNVRNLRVIWLKM